MPTYDYECDACNHKMEVFQGINDEVLKKCPACKKNKLRRLFGAGAAIMFKGSGFYQTDYRSDSYHKAAKADKAGEGSGSETKSETKSESKTESKPETKSTPAAESKPSKGKKDKG